MTLQDVFGSQEHVNCWQECGRAVVVFLYGLILVRVSGRRVFGKWAALDIVVSIIIGSNLSRAITGNAALGSTMAASTVLMALHWVLAHAAARSPWFAKIVEGTALEVARDGRADQQALVRDAITEDDLVEALHQSGVTDVKDTARIVLEPSGKLTALKKR